MSRGKHLSLSEARKTGKLDRYAKEHPAEGDADLLDATIPPPLQRKGSDDERIWRT